MEVGIIGITGRVGSILQEIVENDSECKLAGGICSKNISADFIDLAKKSDIFIDFSSSKAAVEALLAASSAKIPFVSGTTGFSEAEMNTIKSAASQIPVLHAGNFSIGVHLMAIMLKKCSEVLKDFDVSIIDKHHKHKKDAPSGTALFLAKSVENPQILSIRSGGIFGDHICDFIGENEMLTISHRAFNRKVFADNALKCAKWLCTQKPGFYSIVDWLEK